MAAAAGLAVAVAIATASAQSGHTVTLGNASGTPTENICVASIDCTYVPYTNVGNPTLQVPFDGTVTSFSVNSMSSTGTVRLRVLRPAGSGKFTGAGTGAPETLAAGMNTFKASLPVKAGDVLALDNESSALIFESPVPPAIAAYYELPPLGDGETAEPNNNAPGKRLLLSAVVEAPNPTPTTPTTTSTSTTPTGTLPGSTTPPVPPVVTALTQSHRAWRVGNALAKLARSRPPIGTTFSFALDQQASVQFAFAQRAVGRKVAGKCAAPTRGNRHGRACKRAVPRGTLTLSGHAGTDRLSFQGRVSASKRLSPGAYTLTVTASNASGQRSVAKSISFSIVR
jgi:hypothetical protein